MSELDVSSRANLVTMEVWKQILTDALGLNGAYLQLLL